MLCFHHFLLYLQHLRTSESQVITSAKDYPIIINLKMKAYEKR
nr:MAG TPA: hypothetical protein [Caudoviricetes sp.]DAR59715.1 MAG TPA: hypothetical protein [Bacteriophage sp.]